MKVTDTKAFDEKEYDVTDVFCQFLACVSCPLTFIPLIPGIMGKKELILSPEEVFFNVNCCGICGSKQRRPYGELGSVDAINFLCCVGVNSGVGSFFPGCGCRHQFVTEIVHELKTRMQARGDTGQIRKLDTVLSEITEIKASLSTLLSHFDLSPPTPSEISRT